MTERAVTAPARVPQSRCLAESLQRAHAMAREQGARHVALEHLLVSFLTDPETAPVLAAAGIDLARLETDLFVHLEALPDKLLPGEAAALEWHPDLLRMLDYSMAAAAQSGRPAITGAIVLAALIGEGKTTAARVLRAQGLTFEAAIGAMRASPAREGPAREGAAREGPVREEPPREPRGPPSHTPVEGRARAPQPSADRLPSPVEEDYEDRQFGAGPDSMQPDRAAPPSARQPSPVPRAQRAPPPQAPMPPAAPFPAPARHQREEFQGPPRHPPSPATSPAQPPLRQPPPRGGPASSFPETSPANSTRPIGAPPAGPPPAGPPPAGPPPAGPPLGGPHPSSHATGHSERARPLPPHAGPPHAGPPHAGPPHAGPEAGSPGEPHLPPTIAPGELVENIPRRMRVGITEMIEVRIARDKIDGLEIGLQGRGMPVRHDLYVTKAMVVRLKSPDGSFWVEPGSPETEWIENSLGLLPGEFARWRFSITPRRRGNGRLQLVVSARTVGSDGLTAETALPDQTIEVKVRTNYGRLLRNVSGWTAAMLVGGVLGKFGERLLEVGLVFSRKFGGP